jgi:hypothetical protein
MLPRSLARVLSFACALALGPVVASCGGSPGTPTTQTFVGRVDGSNAFVGLAITGENANLFFCGAGATLATDTHWIPGTVPSGQTFTFTDGTASATGTTHGTYASGTFTPTPSAAPLSWSADLVASGTMAGVYDEQNEQGNAALIVVQPSATAKPVAQGAYLPPRLKGAILQVTPYAPLVVTQQGIAVLVPLGGSNKKWFLPLATGN